MKTAFITIILVGIATLLFIAGFYNNGNKSLKQQLAATEAELKELKVKLDKISAENKRIQVLQENIAKLQIDISNLTKEKEKILQENTTLENKNISYEDIIKSLKQQNTELERRIKELETAPDKSSGAKPVQETPPEVIPPKEPIENIKYASPFNSLNTLPKDKIIVVRNDRCDERLKKDSGLDGNYDKIQDVLNRMHIEHTLIGKSELENDSFNWNDKWAIIFNDNFFQDHCCTPGHKAFEPIDKRYRNRSRTCPGTGPHQVHNTKLSDKTIKKIKQFVETGGYLFTEDSQIEEIIERAFNGMIVHTLYPPEQEVKILPAPGSASHPYLKYVFEAPPPPDASITPPPEISTAKPVWKINYEGPNIKIRNKNAVTILIVSPELAKKNRDEGTVAVTWGAPLISGRVLHIIGDLGKQGILIQNLIFNFLSELNELQPREKKGK